MSAIRYPVAPNAEAALNAPLGRAAREREAKSIAGRDVVFITDPVGDSFESREAALDANPGRLDDDRAGRISQVAPEDRFCELREIVPAAKARQPIAAPVEPVFAEGRRWPKPAAKSLPTR